MGIGTSLNALANVIDPTQAYWSILLTTGKTRSERDLVGTWHKGVRGVRRLDWGDDIVSTGDIARIKEIALHCPDGQKAVLETMHFQEETVTRLPAFQFKTRSISVIDGGGAGLEYQVIGRVVDTATGKCECFIWDYHPRLGTPHLIAYKSNIREFGAWKNTMMPIGALSLEVQGFRL